MSSSTGDTSDTAEVQLPNGYSKSSESTKAGVNGFCVSKNVKDSVELRIPVPWGHIAAQTYGNPKGYPVLAVHGWMDNSGTFDKLVPMLSKSLYVVSVDLPGHGLSSHIPTGLPYNYTQDSLIALRRITNHFKWTRFSWLGHSMGAGLGVLYASVFPTQVMNRRVYSKSPKSVQVTERLSSSYTKNDNINSTINAKISNQEIDKQNHSIVPQVERLIMLDLVKPVTGDGGKGYADQMATGIDKFLAMEDKIQPIAPSYDYEDALDRLVKATYNSLTVESAKILMARGAKLVKDDKWSFTRDLRLRSPSITRFTNEQLFAILQKIRCELLFIKAKSAPWFEPEELCQQTMDIYKNHCSSFEYVEVDGNHFVHLNEPEKIVDIVNQFLTKPPAVTMEKKPGL